jgi:type IV pilus assembly protein PilE
MARLPCRSSLAGFTLIEVMTVVAVIGILIAIALPNYQEYVLRAKLVDAGSSLAQVRVRLEQYYQDNRSYPVADDCKALVEGANSKYFGFSCTIADDAQGFTVTATGTDAGGTSAFAYTIDEKNNRKTTAMPSGWSSENDCWVTTRGQKCK